MEFLTIDKFAKEVAEKALDEIVYEGKTVREWVEIIVKQQLGEAILDKIIAEILDEAEYAYADFDEYKEMVLYVEPDELPDDDFRYGMERAVEIINKYTRGI